MFDIHFSPRGKHELEKLPRNIQERIVKKLGIIDIFGT